MSFKLKHMLFGKIAIILTLCLVLNNTFVFNSYADDALSVSPLYIPIREIVMAVAIGSGIVAVNAKDKANELITNVISDIKSSEVAKKQANSSYVSPYKVINGGNSEEPDDDNKNGKWVALAGGAIASNELYANKEMINDIMQKINSYKAYQKFNGVGEFYALDDIKVNGTASNVSLQLAKISNICVTQFDRFLHSSFWDDKDFGYEDCLFCCSMLVSNVIAQTPKYPRSYITVILPNDDVKYIKCSTNFTQRSYSNTYGSAEFAHLGYSKVYTYDSEYNAANIQSYDIFLQESALDSDFAYRLDGSASRNYYNAGTSNDNNFAYAGFKWAIENPWNVTNNVYNVNQTFEVNFPNWIQEQINLIGQGLMDAVRLGISDLNMNWNESQPEIQTGKTPNSVINQYINYYESPSDVPETETETDPDPEPAPGIVEPLPTNDYLEGFLLPETITTKFPFCIPFDIVRALRLFSVSQRVAPKWECDLVYGSNSYHIVIDLAMFNDVASFIRPLEYILFLVGLAIGTRS